MESSRDYGGRFIGRRDRFGRGVQRTAERRKGRVESWPEFALKAGLNVKAAKSVAGDFVLLMRGCQRTGENRQKRGRNLAV